MNDQKEIDKLLSEFYLLQSEIGRLQGDIDSHKAEINVRMVKLADFQRECDKVKEKLVTLMVSSHTQSKS